MRPMSVETETDPLARGEEALHAGDWDTARSAFEGSLAEAETARAHDGLGRALWWLGDLEGALDHRERAYVGYRQEGGTADAARIALWLSREYLDAVGNEPASNGWVARARGLLSEHESGPEDGWLEITLGELAVDPPTIRSHGEAALEIGRAARRSERRGVGPGARRAGGGARRRSRGRACRARRGDGRGDRRGGERPARLRGRLLHRDAGVRGGRRARPPDAVERGDRCRTSNVIITRR